MQPTTKSSGSYYSTIQFYIINPVLSQKKRLSVLLVSLAVLSLSQALLLVLIGPMIKALFLPGGSGEKVGLDQVLQSNIIELFPKLGQVSFDRLELCFVVPAAILLAGFLKSVASYFYSLNQQGLALFVSKSFRDKLFEALLHKPYRDIKSQSPGQWMSRIMNDVLFLQTRLSDILSSFVRDSVIIITSFAVLSWLHWPSALIMLTIGPVIALGMGAVGKRIASYAEAFQRELAGISASLLDLRARFDFIRAQRGEALESERFDRLNNRYFEAIKKSIFVRSAFAPGMELLGFGIFSATLFAVSRGYWTLSPEVLFQFFGAMGLMLRPLRNLGEQLARFHETTGSLKSNFEIFESAQGSSVGLSKLGTSRVDPSLLKSPDLSIDLKKIVVRYGEVCALTLDNLTIQSGKSIAIIGPSGAGKSTLVRTLCGLIPPNQWEGSLSNLELSSLTSMVSQEPFLFDDQLRANLIYGRPVAPSDGDIRSALETVNIWQEVQSQAEGLETPVRAIGSNWSGGQLQRLVIARALLQQKPILLLDEATSAIDAQTEQDITERLTKLSRDQNIGLLVVTHRLRWLELFDEIWFLEDGKLIGVGPHTKLLANPRYKSFCNDGLEVRDV
jgi:ABC-type multidrug transport system fused ATPase/permease subunit